MPAKDYYAVLGVSPQDSEEEIRRAFRRKAMAFHPDRNKAPGAEERFKEVNAAYQVLSNAQKRAAYDRQRSAMAGSRAGASRPTPGNSVNRTQQEHTTRAEQKRRDEDLKQKAYEIARARQEQAERERQKAIRRRQEWEEWHKQAEARRKQRAAAGRASARRREQEQQEKAKQEAEEKPATSSQPQEPGKGDRAPDDYWSGIEGPKHREEARERALKWWTPERRAAEAERQKARRAARQQETNNPDNPASPY